MQGLKLIYANKRGPNNQRINFKINGHFPPWDTISQSRLGTENWFFSCGFTRSNINSAWQWCVSLWRHNDPYLSFVLQQRLHDEYHLVAIICPISCFPTTTVKVRDLVVVLQLLKFPIVLKVRLITVSTMTSWHKINYRIPGPFWGEPTGNHWIPLTIYQ